MEGVAYLERLAYEMLEESLGEEVDRVSTAGGGSRSDTWMTIRANVLRKPVVRMRHADAAVGAAILAASTTMFDGLGEAAAAMTRLDQEVEPSTLVDALCRTATRVSLRPWRNGAISLWQLSRHDADLPRTPWRDRVECDGKPVLRANRSTPIGRGSYAGGCRGSALARVPLEAIYVSPLIRSRETGELVADATSLPVTSDPRLIEIDFGAWEGLTARGNCTCGPAGRAAWLSDPSSVPAGGTGETGKEVNQRLQELFNEIAATHLNRRSP